MKKMYFLLVILCISLQSLYSVEFDKSKLPKLLGASNMGREFYFSFIPAWQGHRTDLILYISSNVKTKVIVEVPGKGYSKIKYTIPNDIIEFTLYSSLGQPTNKSPWSPPERDAIFRGAGIHVKADDPIICYGVTRYAYTSDGFLALPVNSLGKEYIIASYPDVASNDGQWFPSEFTVTAPYDNTKVLFTMGGTSASKTVGGQLPLQTTQWLLNSGDVFLVSSLGHLADLTGSKIEASKPVAVVSGNFCAYIPTNCGCCDFIMEMELPTETWGTQYHITPIINRLKNSIIRVFAKEPSTNIYRDNDLIGNIQTAGGISGVGWLDMRADTGKPRPITIHSDKPIGVTQYNTGQQDDGITSDPFQMVLVPTEQYQKETMFNTPGIRGGFGFPQNYINLCYEATDSNTIPEDLEFAQIYNGEFFWEKLKEMSPNPGTPFIKLTDNKNYYSKTFILPGDGVYYMRSKSRFQAYMYGFSWCDSYGFPASFGTTLIEWSKDTLPPVPTYSMDCAGNVFGQVDDRPDTNSSTSLLASITLQKASSYNYSLEYEFEKCQITHAEWEIKTLNPFEDAYAVLSFKDCAGNDTSINIEYLSPNKLAVETNDIFFGEILIGDTVRRNIKVYNKSSENKARIDKIQFRSTNTINSKRFFKILMKDEEQIVLPLEILPSDSIEFIIEFNPTNIADFQDSLGFGDSCNFYYQVNLGAGTYGPMIQAGNFNFFQVDIDYKKIYESRISNKGTSNVKIYDIILPKSTGNINGEKYLIFDSDTLQNLKKKLVDPLIIKPNESYTFDISFRPDSAKQYIDSIVFISNSIVISQGTDSVCVLRGHGRVVNYIHDEVNELIQLYPNPTEDILIIDKLPMNTSKIQIFDETGKEVKSIEIKNQSESLKISTKDLPVGAYILRMFVGAEVLDRKFVVVR